jgi:hypothetical protein
MAVLGALALVGVACEPSATSTRRGAARTQPEAYLCCTLRFNPSDEASDANYDYRDKTQIQAGTRVRVVRMTDAKVEFVPEGVSTTYSIEYRYGRKVMRGRDFFERLFLAADPRAGETDAAVRDAVRDGRLIPGMTKAQAIMARGYPPFHHTASTDADEWLYYSHSKLCEKVRFVDGRLASIQQVEPPN